MRVFLSRCAWRCSQVAVRCRGLFISAVVRCSAVWLVHSSAWTWLKSRCDEHARACLWAPALTCIHSVGFVPGDEIADRSNFMQSDSIFINKNMSPDLEGQHYSLQAFGKDVQHFIWARWTWSADIVSLRVSLCVFKEKGGKRQDITIVRHRYLYTQASRNASFLASSDPLFQNVHTHTKTPIFFLIKPCCFCYYYIWIKFWGFKRIIGCLIAFLCSKSIPLSVTVRYFIIWLLFHLSCVTLLY